MTNIAFLPVLSIQGRSGLVQRENGAGLEGRDLYWLPLDFDWKLLAGRCQRTTPGQGDSLQTLLLRPPLHRRGRIQSGNSRGYITGFELPFLPNSGNGVWLPDGRGVEIPGGSYHSILELRAILTTTRWWVKNRKSTSLRFLHLTDSFVCLHIGYFEGEHPVEDCEEHLSGSMPFFWRPICTPCGAMRTQRRIRPIGQVGAPIGENGQSSTVRHLEGRSKEDRARIRKTLGKLKDLTVQLRTRIRYEKAR